MKVSCNAISVVHEGKDTHTIVQSCVLDGDARGMSQGFGQCLVLVGEFVRSNLVGQVQVSVDLVAHSNRDAQERAHRGMVLRYPETFGVFGEIGDAEGQGIGDQKTEDSSAGRTWADLLLLRFRQAHRQELFESFPLAVEHSECAVSGTNQGPCLLDEVIEKITESDVSGNHQHCRKKPLQLLGIIDPGVGHGWIVSSKDYAAVWSVAGRMSVMPIRVFLLDDHELVREGIRNLLESDDDIEVVGEAATAEEATHRIPLARPDVAILDVRLGQGDGIEVCREVRSVVPGLACLMLTSYADDEALYASVMAGAAGYVLKQIKSRDLIADIKRVAAGESLLDPRAVATVVQRISNPPKASPDLAALSPQENRILDLIAQGKTNRQIAEAMFLSEHTVKNYVTGMLRKLKLTSRTEAAIYATKVRSSGEGSTG